MTAINLSSTKVSPRLPELKFLEMQPETFQHNGQFTRCQTSLLHFVTILCFQLDIKRLILLKKVKKYLKNCNPGTSLLYLR